MLLSLPAVTPTSLLTKCSFRRVINTAVLFFFLIGHLVVAGVALSRILFGDSIGVRLLNR